MRILFRQRLEERIVALESSVAETHGRLRFELRLSKHLSRRIDTLEKVLIGSIVVNAVLLLVAAIC